MPKRMIRDWTASETVDQLSPGAEIFFTRLIMKVDDYGNYTGNIKLINAALFPLKGYSVDQVSMWFKECEVAGLIISYEVDKKPLIHIKNFNQKLRRMRAEYPPPPDGQVTDNVRTSDGQKTAEEEEKKKRREGERKNATPTKTFGKPPGNFITVKAKYIHDPVCKIYGTQGLVEYMAENQTILNQPEYADRFLRAFNGQVYNELTHVQNAYRKFITDSHK